MTAIARRARVPSPSLLALGGIAIALVPSAPSIPLDPELALVLFLAPVLLDAAYDTSIRDLKQNWIPVTCLVLIARADDLGRRLGGALNGAGHALGSSHHLDSC